MKYKPGTWCCRHDYWATGRSELGRLPRWELHGEDGSVFSICREVNEVIGHVFRPGRPTKTAYGSGPGDEGPIIARGRFNHPEPDEIELKVINAALYPYATERTWVELQAEFTPCDHTDDFCVLNPTGRYRDLP